MGGNNTKTQLSDSDMLEFIQQTCQKKNFPYIQLSDHNVITEIYDGMQIITQENRMMKMFDYLRSHSKKLENKLYNSNIECDIAIYYGIICDIFAILGGVGVGNGLKDVPVKYYLAAFSKGNKYAPLLLGNYYKKLFKGNNFYNYKSDKIMAKYYILALAIDDTDYKDSTFFKNNYNSIIYFLGDHYEKCERNVSKMKKYYKMASETGIVGASIKMALYYKDIKRDYVKMEKYFVLAAERGNIEASYHLGKYYKNIDRYEEMIKYLTFASEKGCVDAMNELAKYYKDIGQTDDMKKYYLLASMQSLKNERN